MIVTKQRTARTVLMIVAVSGILSLPLAGTSIRFNDNWKFYRGDVAGAQASSYSDAAWKTVYVPHADSILINYATSSYYLGYCWYRKTFTMPSSYIGKKIFLQFEGAMQTANVYYNDSLLVTHLGGYTPFMLDVTKYVKFGATNVIAVRLNNSSSTAFPPGNANPDMCYFGGLYRDVTLIVTDSLHITDPLCENSALGGIFVTYPSVTTASATVKVRTQVRNETKAGKSVSLVTAIMSVDTQQVVATLSTTKTIASTAADTFSQTLTVTNPALWHPQTPNLYIVRSQVISGSVIKDQTYTTIGIRSISFSKSGGFVINGSRYKFRGCNRHQYYPYIGNAVPASGHYRDALQIKENGMDFVRMSHYVQPKSFVDACDKLGIMSMACLPGWQYFGSDTAFVNNSLAALRDMIRYYRNHPSIILWEAMENETYGSVTTAFLDSAQKTAHREFPDTQMYTAGEETSGSGTTNKYFDVYMSSSQHGVRSYAGTRACFISEYGDWDYGGLTSTSRVDRAQGDSAMLFQAKNHMVSLNADRGLAWLTGDAVWSMYDYQSWSNDPLTSSGAIDLFRIPKYSAYFFKSQRDYSDTLVPGVKNGPMVFIASAWTSASRRDSLRVYSNCDSVSLYLNGTLVATKGHDNNDSVKNLAHPPISFTIPAFIAGTLRADGKINSVVYATHQVKTPGTPKSISVAIDTANCRLQADGSDIAIVHATIFDSTGAYVSNAVNSITFSVTGPGTLLGANPFAAQAGIATIFVQSTATAGTMYVTASAAGLSSGSATVKTGAVITTGIDDRTASNNTLPVSAKNFVMQRMGNTLVVRISGMHAGAASAKLILCNAMGIQVGQWSLMKADNVLAVKNLPHGVYFGQILYEKDVYLQKTVW